MHIIKHFPIRNSFARILRKSPLELTRTSTSFTLGLDGGLAGYREVLCVTFTSSIGTRMSRNAGMVRFSIHDSFAHILRKSLLEVMRTFTSSTLVLDGGLEVCREVLCVTFCFFNSYRISEAFKAI